MNALLFVFKTLIDLYILTYVVRFVLQWVRADFYNPFSQFIVRVTNPLVVPARRILPRWATIDLPTLVLVFLLEIAAVLAITSLAGAGIPSAAQLFYYALLRTVLAFLRLFFFAILIYVILSWVNPGPSPIAQLLGTICDPVLRPVRRLVPLIGGIDLSPLFVLIGLQAVMILIRIPPLLA